MNILKSADREGNACNRFFFEYEGIPGEGHFLHTYQTDGNPIPTFIGEPERVAIPDDIDSVFPDVCVHRISMREQELTVISEKRLDILSRIRKDTPHPLFFHKR